MKAQEEIREIWDEMKMMDRYRKDMPNFPEERIELEKKYEEIETLFGHESTLSKAIIYYLNKQEEFEEEKRKKLSKLLIKL